MKPGNVALSVLFAVGILSIVASSVTEEETETPPVPVVVDYTITTSTDGLSRDIDTRTDTVASAVLTGSYDAFQGNALTLDRASVTVEANSTLELLVTPKTTDETLDGTASVSVTSDMDIGLNRNPTAGVFSSEFAGTTTSVMVVADGVKVTVADEAPQSFSWSNFIALADDTQAAADERMSAIAYSRLIGILRATLFAEDLTRDIESNRQDLEGSNLNTPLPLTCDNTANDGDGQYSLLWTADAAGSGAGEIGAGDSLQARFRNCRLATRDRFYEGNVDLRGYSPDRGAGLRLLSAEVEFSTVFVAEEMIDFNTTVSPTTPQLDGTLTLSYLQSEPAP